jgi:hypothetical protein
LHHRFIHEPDHSSFADISALANLFGSALSI